MEHRAVEQLVPLVRPNLTFETYVQYLKTLHSLYKPLESNLRGVDGLAVAVPDIELRWKADLIRADLQNLDAFGGDSELLSTAVPECRALAEALGVMYVLEGSTLGGQILTRMVREKLGTRVTNGLGFLASYRNETGVMWHRFGNYLRAALTAENATDAIAGAKATFAAFHGALEAGREEYATA